MELTKQEIIEIINSMEIVHADDSGCLYFVYVRDNEENRKKLAKIVPNVEDYVDRNISEGTMYWGDADLIDIQEAAWVYAKADYFDGEKFVYNNRQKLDTLLYSDKNLNNIKNLEQKLLKEKRPSTRKKSILK